MKQHLFFICTALMLCHCSIIQAQTRATIVAADPDGFLWTSSGGEFFFPVQNVTTKDWLVEVKEPQNWIQVEKKDTLGFLITMCPNETGIDRNAIIKLFSTEKEELLKFTQLGDKEIIAGLAFDYREQTQWIDASSKFTRVWNAKVNSEAANWAYATRHGDDGIMLNLNKNEQRTKRTFKLIIHDADKVLAALLVNQYPDPLPLSKYSYSVRDKASTITLDAGVKDSLIFQLPDWIQIHSKQETDNGIRYQFAIENNPMDIARYDSIRIHTKSGTGQSEIAISQYGYSPYTPVGVEALCDTLITIASGEASSFQEGEGIERSFDGNFSTLYHSSYHSPEHDSLKYFPISLIYKFQKPEIVDYLEYHPRTDGGTNGIFQEVEVWTQAAGEKDFCLKTNANLNGSTLMERIEFPHTQKNIVAVKLVIKSGMGTGCGFASCAEMRFYRKVKFRYNYTDIFTDSTCYALKPGITEHDIDRVCSQPFFHNLAMHLLSGDYPNEFRVQNYKAWETPDIQAQKNGTMPFSLYDNPTGIAAVEGEPLVVFVGHQAPEAKRLAIVIQNLNLKSDNDGYGGPSYFLHTGLNVIYPDRSGLVYLLYQSDTPESTSPVRVHFATGRVNGYFDATKHISPDGTSRWNELLARAGDKYFDVLSNHVHFTFRAEDFRRYVPDVNKLLAAYDMLVCHEQEFAGLKKYNRWMNNRLYIHTTYREMLYATPYHIGFQESQLPLLLHPDSLKGAHCWGPAHELGHVLQVSPSMKWTGMTEVTNNIQSMEIQRLWGNPSRLHTVSRSMNGYNNIYEQAMNVAFVQKRPFAYLSDWFDQLVPFWQLRLYVMDICGKEDFYKDVYEASRLQNAQDTRLTSGQLQLEFVYNSCVAAGIDLRPFFEKWGWLQATERIYDDYYGKDTITVNPADIEQLNTRIKALHLPIPAHAAEYITDNTLNLYKYPQPFLPGTAQINPKTGEVYIKDASGAVAFEVYEDKKIIGVSYQPIFKTAALEGTDTSKIHVKAVSPKGKRSICKML